MPVSIANGSTDVTQYFVMRDSTNHAPKTNVTITDIDLYYQEELVAQAAKVDATALAAADSAHADNKGYHCGNGLYRIDWPDAAFDGGVGKKVILIVVCTGCDTIFREVQLGVNVGTNADKTGYGLADDAITSAKFDESTAFPLKSADTGATILARPGDAMTLTAAYDDAKTAAQAGDAMTLTAAYDAAATAAQAGDAMDLIDAPSATALNAAADALLKREWTGLTGEAARSVLNALRLLRNKWSVAAGVLTATKEDDSTPAWTAALTTDADADPITASDPAGPA